MCVIPPQSYLAMLCLTKYSKFVITDSGGLQKEAYYLKRSVFVLKEDTEWPELLATGLVRLIKPESYNNIMSTLQGKSEFVDKVINNCPYGNGSTSKDIASILCKLNSDAMLPL